jgi:hypothetical protein
VRFVVRYSDATELDIAEICRAFTQKFPYSLHFRIEGEIVHVYGCLHHKRDPKIWPAPNA